MNWWHVVIRRLATSLLVLLATLSLTFVLSRYADGDPVLTYQAMQNGQDANLDIDLNTASYRKLAQKFGLDVAPFFWTLQPTYYPDTLHRIFPLARRQQAKDLLRKGYAWEGVEQLQMERWTQAWTSSEIQAATNISSSTIVALPRVGMWEKMALAVRWQGWDNAYTRFLGGCLRGDLGLSLINGRPVATQLWQALTVTLPLALTALLLSVVVGLAFGYFMVRSRLGIWNDLAYVLLSLPGFLLVTVAVLLLSGRGAPFPGPGWYTAGGLGTWLQHATLPILILVIPTAAYIGLIFSEALTKGDYRELRDVSRLAGFTERELWLKDMFRLGLVPAVVTVVGLLIPSFLGGFVVIELVFNIPGIGRLVLSSILARDWPMVIGVVILSSVLTVIGYTFIAWCNAFLDPRLRAKLGKRG